MARFERLSYAAKIVVPIIASIAAPMVALVLFASFRPARGPFELSSLLVAGLATIATSIAVSLVILTHLLRPIAATSRVLREYRASRSTGHLPIHHKDLAGTLMADVTDTLVRLEQIRRSFEYIDESTGLPNRKRLIFDMVRRMETGSRFLICAIRLDNYQQLAENLDLRSAENVVFQTSTRLQSAVQFHHLYRITHRDFIVLRPLAAGEDIVQDFATPLRTAITDCAVGIAFASVTVEPTLLAGIAIHPDDGDDADDLIDCALGAATSSSSDIQVSFHTPALRQAGRERLQLGQDLRQALENNEFVLHYQPIVDLAHGGIIGAEALIRWQHPLHGLLPPARFIPEAEKSGAIDAIGLWVMSEACRQARAWDDQGLRRLRIAINLSARQFLDVDLIDSVDRALSASGVSPDRLEIELTETATMADESYSRAALARLKDLGVSIAIDDFGTGYASLSCLRRLPFDKLKIDREFVTQVHLKPDSRAICSALIALADGLNLRVIAEGVETAEEVAFLRMLGCDLFQGFYFSKGLPAIEFARTVDRLAGSVKAIRGQTMRTGDAETPPPRRLARRLRTALNTLTTAHPVEAAIFPVAGPPVRREAVGE